VTARIVEPWRIPADDPRGTLALAGYFRPPGIRLDLQSDRLLYEVGWTGIRRVAAPDSRILSDFLRLADANASRIESFAKRWGPLGLCAHGEPSVHSQPPCPIPTKRGSQTRWEALAAWRGLSARARAILVLAQRLRSNQRPAIGEWRAAIPGQLQASETIGSRGEATFASELNQWLRDADLTPQLQFVRLSQPLIRFATPTAFGAVALHVVLAALGAREMETCGACELPFLTERRRASSRRRWCARPECVTTRNRIAKRESRARRSAQ
jgi:hypothetical protein